MFQKSQGGNFQVFVYDDIIGPVCFIVLMLRKMGQLMHVVMISAVLILQGEYHVVDQICVSAINCFSESRSSLTKLE